MDKQKQIEEMSKDIELAVKIAIEWLLNETKEMLEQNGHFKSTEHTRTLSDIVAEELHKKKYRKISDDVVILTRVTHNRLKRDSELYEARCKEKLKLFAKIYNQSSKETVNKFAKKLKEKFAYDVERCKAVDEIAKELLHET